MSDTPFVLLAVQSVLGLYGTLYLTTAICTPRWFLDTLAINHIQRRLGHVPNSTSEPWWIWPWSILTMLAVGALIYAAIYSVIAVIPHEWGSHDEDGQWMSLRYSIQIGAAIFGGMFLVGRLENNAEVLVWGPLEHKARKAATNAIRHTRGVTQEMRDQIALSAEEALEPDELYRRGYQMDYAKDVQRWVGSSIRS